METKEKSPEKAAPARKRPPSRAPGDRPVRKPMPQAEDAVEEVFVPDADSQQIRHAAAEQYEAPPARRVRTNVPEQQSAAKKKPAKGKKAAKAREPQYRPYHKANQKVKRKKRQDFRQNVHKFFSWQNPVAKLFYKEDPNVFGDDASAVRKAKRAAEAEKKRKRAERLNTPAVIYTTPTAFNSSRLIVQLLTVLTIVLALVLGMSVFFKVKVITVSGANVYSAWTVREKSGITLGDNLLTFGRTKASGQIIANLPYVKSARIGIKLPDTVNIEIEEEAVVYSIQDQDGVWWLINSNGKVVEQTSALNARSYTQVLGVTLNEPQPGEAGMAWEQPSAETDASGELVPVMITGTQRFNSALKILQALELNDIVGDAASVDVSQLQDIILWYGTQYQVNLGNIDRMDYKITYMKNAILQMSDYQTGILDVSFTTWPDQAGYTPFG